MISRYKIIISNRNVYKEFDLLPEFSQVKIGTETDCDYRIRKDIFFDKIELTFINNGENWSVACSDNLYFDIGDVRKLLNKQLRHGDIFFVKYQNSDNEVFSIEFVIDFDNGQRKYERAINVSSVPVFRIGVDKSHDIVINSPFVHNDSVELRYAPQGLHLLVHQSSYGVYHNGTKIGRECIIQNGNFFSLSDFIFYYKDGILWTEIRDGVYVRNLPCGDYPESNSYPKFNRNTRVRLNLNKDDIEILDPPASPQKPKNNLLTRLLPSMGMMLASAVMAMSGQGAMIVMSIISGGMAIVTTVVNLLQGNKEYKEGLEERKNTYNKYINEKRQQIEQLRADEKNVLDEIYISSAEEQDRFSSFSHLLFDRTPQDSDFLAVRLGDGYLEAERKIKYKKQEKLSMDDELQVLPEKVYEDYKYISNAPIVCDLKKSDAIGIIGNAEYRFDIFRNIVVDIIARQYFSDVKLVFVAEEKNADKIYWLRMLPHVNKKEFNIQTVVTDDESKNIVFEYLYKEFTIRQQTKKYDEHIVIFFYDEYQLKSHPISKFVKDAKAIGVTFVFFGDTAADIPLGCDNVIALDSANTGRLISTGDANNWSGFTYNPIPLGVAQKLAEIMIPVYSEEISLEGSLTKSISMFELLNIIAVDDLNLDERWNNSAIFKSMAAPLGVSKTGIVNLDLHDKAHGPHGLVAGTTGSGKSEILQTYILSMATLFHPYEVGFVIIDFKGGGMVNQFKDLPHLVGAITNIDGKEIDRSLKSIKAELQKRQRLFAEAEVNHIDKYIRKFKAGEVEIPLPHLILIVDEFAELKAEQPEFMKELISAARIGRSLGVHLILATQKPSGQVNEQIWSNSKFKLCLKVQSQEDSNEVLKSPLAAEIKEPGRAYLQVGNNEIFELFQSAYSGAPEKMDDTSVKEFTINSVSVCGKRTPVFVQKRKKAEGANTTQLDAIVDYVSAYCSSKSIKRLPSICLPSLKKEIIVPSEIKAVDNRYPIGIYDDPDTQYQGNALFDFDNNNTFIVGSSQSGKTNLLQLIIREIASVKKADEACFYLIDFGSMILKNFEELNHVGGVVISSEEEKFKNLFKLIMQELEIRKEKLMSVGVSSVASYVDAGYNDIPHIYIVLDNFAVFKELYSDKFEDELLYIAREGITYGISMIITAATSNGFGYKYMSNFANHIAFSCNDNSEYSNLFDRCKMEPGNNPGRMLVCFNKVIYEAQSFLSFKGEKEIERITEIKKFVESRNALNNGKAAKRIPEVPDNLTMDYIDKNFIVNNSEQIAVALDYQNVEPVAFNINSTPQLAIIGKLSANIVGFEKALLKNIKNNYFDRPAYVYIIDSFARDLISYSDEPYVEEYSIDYSILSNVFETVSGILEERYEEVLEDGVEILNNKPLLLVMINNPSAIEFISSSKNLLNMYNNIISKYKAMKIMLVFGGINDENIGYSSGDVLKKLKENKNALIFTNIGEHKVFDVPPAFARQNKKAIDNTQGYYIKENEIVKIRFAKEEK